MWVFMAVMLGFMGRVERTKGKITIWGGVILDLKRGKKKLLSRFFFASIILNMVWLQKQYYCCYHTHTHTHP